MSAISDEINSTVALFDAVLSDLDKLLRDTTPADLDLADALQCRDILASPSLALVREKLQNLIGDALPHYETVVDGYGVVRRHKKKAGYPKVIDDDDLWRAVLDTRIVDPVTGEVLPQFEIIKRAYGSQSRETGVVRLTGASKAKVKALGLDPDMFFEEPEQRPGWDLEVIN